MSRRRHRLPGRAGTRPVTAVVLVVLLWCAGCGATAREMRAETGETGMAGDGLTGSDDPGADPADLSACRQDGLFDLVSDLVKAVDDRDAAAMAAAFTADARWSVYDHFGSNALTGAADIRSFASELAGRSDRWTLAGIEPPDEDLTAARPVATSVIRLTVTAGGKDLERRAKVTVDCSSGELLRMAGPHSVS